MTTLRDLVGQDASVLNPRTEAEEAATARMPGDKVKDHPLYRPPNPYLTKPNSQLREMLRKGVSSRDEERLIRAALSMQELQHSDGKPKAGDHR